MCFRFQRFIQDPIYIYIAQEYVKIDKIIYSSYIGIL